MTDFTAGEREYIRRELDQFFGTLPSVADGFQLRTWRGGPQKDQPKLPPAAKSLLDRGLMRLDQQGRLPRLFFTEAGMVALRDMMVNARFADPVKFAHIRVELDIEPARNASAAEVTSAFSAGTMPTVSLVAVVSSGPSIPAVLDKLVGNPYYGE